MKYAVESIILGCVCLSLGICCLYAAEPILVIDPHGHSSKITDLMFTPDGKTLISVAEDKTIRLWEVETGELQRTLRHPIGTGRDGVILAGALSPDGKWLAVGGIAAYTEDGTPVYLFDLVSGDLVHIFGGQRDTVNDLKFSPNGRWLAIGSGSEIRIWDVIERATAPEVILESADTVFSLAIAPDGKSFVSGHVDGTLQRWTLPAKMPTSGTLKLSPQQTLHEHTSVVSCVDYAPDGQTIISGDFDGNKLLWDAQSGRLKRRLTLTDTTLTVVFAPDSQSVLVNDGPEAVLLSPSTGQERLRFRGHASSFESIASSYNVTAAAFWHSDLVATAGGNEYTIDIWDAQTGTVKTHIVGQGQRVENVAWGEGLQVAFGNTFAGIQAVSPLERSFDFAALTLSQQIGTQADFVSPHMTYQGRTLIYEWGNWYELRITGGGIIRNGPKDGWVRAYTFTPDGNVVVGSSAALRLHRQDGSALREFRGHTGEVWGVSVSRDGALLASASDDQTIKLWNIATGECLATLFIARDREWICWTPLGYYAASAGGEKYIGWHVNQGSAQAAAYYPVAVFRHQFYNPELVKHTILLRNFDAARKTLPEPLLLQQRAVILPPTIDWIEPAIPVLETTARSVHVRAKIRSDSTINDNQILQFKLFINGRPVAAEADLRLSGRESDHYKEFAYDVSILAERTEVTIFAATSHADVVSEKRVIIAPGSAADRLKPNLYVVSVGISDYPTAAMQLTYADDDAQAITRLFSAQKGKLYRDVQVKALYDADATRANIIEALEWLEQQAQQGDVALIFIAAHGLRSGKENFYYILPVDGNPEKLRSTGVDWGIFAEVLGNLPAQVLLLLDTCHSGQLGQDLSAALAQRDNTEALRTLASDGYGVVILAASTGQQLSQERAEWGHGAFTAALLEALEQGLADYPPKPDGIIHLRELDLYVDTRVRELTSDTQSPTTQKPSTITRFPIVQLKHE